MQDRVDIRDFGRRQPTLAELRTMTCRAVVYHVHAACPTISRLKSVRGP